VGTEHFLVHNATATKYAECLGRRPGVSRVGYRRRSKGPSVPHASLRRVDKGFRGRFSFSPADVLDPVEEDLVFNRSREITQLEMGVGVDQTGEENRIGSVDRRDAGWEWNT
jgi:hypothetical protein